MTNNTQLPAEVVEYIITWVITFALAYHKSKNKDISNDAAEYITDELSIPNPLTEYAIKLHQAEQEIASLKQWKSESIELLNPILDYGQSKEADIPLGASVTSVVLERCKKYKEAIDLLGIFIKRHETGLLPDRFIYNDIKSFLDGQK